MEVRMNSDVVHLLRSQTQEATQALSDAFSRDPILNYFLSENQTEKLNALNVISEKLLNYCQPYNHIYTTSDNVKGIAMWLPPETSSFTWSELWNIVTSGILTVPFYVRWDRIVDVLAFMIAELVRRQRYVEPHWYLAVLGVSSQYQGQGIGGELLQPILQQADRDKIPCYLETSTESAVRFYQRQGFEIEHIGKIGETLPYWTMKRLPKA
jgi:ribosomal protein S18 acetylase RimI-like enzyme